MKITVYVLQGIHGGEKYVDITNDLRHRLCEHRSGNTKAGQLLGEFELLHTEILPDYETARVREKYLKSSTGRRWLNKQYVTGPASGE